MRTVAKFESVDAYIASLPPEVRPTFESVRQAIHRSVPSSEEAISYDMPSFKRHGHAYLGLAAWKRHISIYPIPQADPEFERQLAPHVAGRGTLQFPLDRPMPLELVARVAALLAEQRAGPPPPNAAATTRR